MRRSGRFVSRARHRTRPGATAEASSPLTVRRLPELDQMTVGIADVATDLVRVLLRRRQEFRTPGAPLGVHGLDVLDPDVEEAADAFGVGWRLQRDRGLVVGRAAAAVDDDPAVGQGDVGRFSRAFQGAAEDVGVETARTLDIVGDDEVGDHDSVCLRSGLGHLPPPLVESDRLTHELSRAAAVRGGLARRFVGARHKIGG